MLGTFLRRVALLSLLLAPGLASAEADPAAVGRLSEALRFETVSPADPADFRPEPFEAFRGFLVESFPLVHERLEREIVSGRSLLYTWRGSDPDAKPVLVTSHYDVVPVPDDTLDDWEHPPFAGVVADGWVWGRGALDDKFGVLATLEAVTRLLRAGFTPERTVYLAFGHDEEIGGPEGAGGITELLASRGVRLAWSLDEGMAVIADALPGLTAPAAMVGIAEKGYVTLELTVDTPGGHSSTPPRHTAVGILARAITRLEANPMPGGLRGAGRALFDYLGPELPLAYRLPLANLWLFEGLIVRRLDDQQAVNALLRTTTAATMFQGSPKENVLPSHAEARVNFRILPGDTSDEVLEFARRVIGDERVQIAKTRKTREPSPTSHTDGPPFTFLARRIGEVYDDAVLAPGLVLGGTDSRHFTPISEHVYRFIPFEFGVEDLARAHGIDERLGTGTFARGIRFYVRMFEAAGPDAGM